MEAFKFMQIILKSLHISCEKWWGTHQNIMVMKGFACLVWVTTGLHTCDRYTQS